MRDLPRAEVTIIDRSKYSVANGELTALFIGAADKGPVGEAIELTSTDDFIKNFGYPNSKASVACYQYLSLSSQKAYFIRTFNPDFVEEV